MSRRGGGPLILLSDDAQRTTGRDAQTMNITAAKAIAQSVRTTLGPRGMDKMLVDSSGNVVVTNDGVTILSEMDIEHPGANMIVEVAESQESEVGDGTTTAVVLAGELLAQAEELLEQDIHPTTIADGYQRAANEARGLLDEIARSVDIDDVDTLEQIAVTVMTGKSTADYSAELAEIVVQAVRAVADDNGRIDLEDLIIKQGTGRPIDESEFVDGLAIEGEPVGEEMPDDIDDARIAILDGDIDVKELETDAEIELTDADQYKEFKEAEQESVRGAVDALADAGADVLFASGDIADAAESYLAESGILAVDGVDQADIARLGRVTGGVVETNAEALGADHLGTAGEVSIGTVGNTDVIFVEDGATSDVGTLVIYGGTDQILDEVERAIADTLHAVQVALEEGAALGGGGAAETALSLALRDYAEGVGGREQLAVEAFAEALEIAPRTLAENAGHDPVDALIELRASHEGGSTFGLDAETGGVIDMYEDGVVEPVPVKRQAVESATEAAVMILRIDDVISAA